MFKRTIALAGALAIASALSLPAISAANWTDGTVNVGENAAITTSGNLSFVGGLGGTTCKEAVGKGTLEPGTTATISESVTTVSSCTTSGGLAGCKVTSVTSTNLPWTAHTNGTTLTTTAVHFDMTYHGAFCPYHELTLKGDTTITPSNSHAAGEGTAGGTVGAYNGTTGAFIQNVTGSGAGNVTPAGTYGLT